MARRDSLKEYQDEVLQKMELARANVAGQQHLLFGFQAAGKNFLMNGPDIVELATPTNLEPIPASKPWAIGVANIKGSVHSITDFSVLLGGERIRRGKFLVLSADIMAGAALLIEGLTGLYDAKDLGNPVPDELITTMPSWITGCFQTPAGRHYLVDGALLAADTKFSKLQSGDI